MPELRIDPLTGQRAIVAGDRAGRPGGGLSVTPPAAIDPDSDPFAEGHEDRTPPEVYAVRPNGSVPNTPGWTVRVVPNLYPALRAATPKQPEPHANPGSVLGCARARRPRGDRQLAKAGGVAVGADCRGRGGGDGRLARAHASSRRRGLCPLIVNERREAGASLPHTHAQLYALDFVPAAHRARARALRRLCDADDGRQPARRPGPGGGAPAGADRRDRRGDGADGALRRARPLPAADRAPHAADALRGRRSRPARRCSTTR